MISSHDLSHLVTNIDTTANPSTNNSTANDAPINHTTASSHNNSTNTSRILPSSASESEFDGDNVVGHLIDTPRQHQSMDSDGDSQMSPLQNKEMNAAIDTRFEADMMNVGIALHPMSQQTPPMIPKPTASTSSLSQKKAIKKFRANTIFTFS